jgi:hypothetical protein
MFSETRYALNGDLRVAYRASAEGERDIVFVPNWFFCCEVLTYAWNSTSRHAQEDRCTATPSGLAPRS